MRYTALFFLSLTLLVAGCATPNQSSNDNSRLFTVGDKSVSSEEFIYVFNKNNFNNDSTITREEIDEYLDLFVNFKLKVKEAEELGLQNEDGFIRELETYRKQLAKPYLTETNVTNALIKEAYDRSKVEVRASHILIIAGPDAAPEDTLAAFNLISELREQIVDEGKDFNKVAREKSQDPSAVQNGGNLGYFTSMQMVYPFEEAAYHTAVGEVSQPFRTRFGYHILQVHDRRDSRGKIKVGHIMIRAAQGINPEDSVRAKNKADELYKELNEGADWFAITRQYSEDLNTKDRGGELPWFGTGNMVPAFENAAFSLESPDDISEPIKTPYGWHIIRLIERQSMPELDEVRESIARQINRDSRAEVNKKALIRRLKDENGFKENKEVVDKTIALVATTAISGDWDVAMADSVADKAMFTINLEPYFARDFIKYARSSSESLNQGGATDMAVRNLYNNWTEQELVAYEEDHLADKYDDYRLLYQEYREGILLFELMDRKVWSKATKDTAGLRNFYEQHIGDYQWGQRYKAAIVKLSDEELTAEVRPYLDQEIFPVSIDEIEIKPGEGDMLFSNLHKYYLDSMARRAGARSAYVLKATLPSGNKAFNDSIIQTLEGLGVSGEKLLISNTDKKEAAFSIMSTSPKDMEGYLNDNRPLAVRIDYGDFEPSAKEELQKVPARPGVYEVESNGTKALVRIYEVLEPQKKELSEIRGQVISDYQEDLEAEWVAQLREKYPVKINEKVLNQIYREFETK